MSQSTHTAITMLLVTTLSTFLVKACPLGSSSGSGNDYNCTQECQAYRDAKASTSPTYLNVTARLGDFRNTPNDFNRKLGTDFEADKIQGKTGEACYFANAEIGCSHFLKVDGTCSWTYKCDYDKNRLPLYLWRASCGSDSETIYYTVPVLRRSDSCNPQPTWQLVMEKVPVGCSCT